MQISKPINLKWLNLKLQPYSIQDKNSKARICEQKNLLNKLEGFRPNPNKKITIPIMHYMNNPHIWGIHTSKSHLARICSCNESKPNDKFYTSCIRHHHDIKHQTFHEHSERKATTKFGER